MENVKPAVSAGRHPEIGIVSGQHNSRALSRSARLADGPKWPPPKFGREVSLEHGPGNVDTALHFQKNSPRIKAAEAEGHRRLDARAKRTGAAFSCAHCRHRHTTARKRRCS